MFDARVPATPGALAFKAFQTYQGGEVVAWADAAGSERPAPLVMVQDSAAAAGEPAPLAGGDRRAVLMSSAALGLATAALALRLRSKS